MKKITALLSVIIVVSLFAAVIPAIADTDTVFPITEGFENYSSSEWTVDEKNVSAGGFLFVDSNGTKTEKWGSEK